MQVKIEKVFTIDAPSASAWQFLQDISGVAGCMPGAEITEQVDDNNYKGSVKVKIGPATAAFKGDIEIKGIDADKRELHMLGTGADVKGTSSASMDLVAFVRDGDDGKCELVGNAAVTVNGKMASLGGRMMTQVSDQILKQFGANFANNVMAMGDGAAAEAAASKAAEQPKELNAFGLMWGVVVGFFKGLFGKK
ncbi:MAG: SRPBCC family protein [Gammaproteobacteria bacterium]|nr:SRPBCC family protein [Gammaproteobacteria bacterium]